MTYNFSEVSNQVLGGLAIPFHAVITAFLSVMAMQFPPRVVMVSATSVRRERPQCRRDIYKIKRMILGHLTGLRVVDW